MSPPVEFKPKCVAVVNDAVGLRVIATSDKNHCLAIIMDEGMIDLVAAEIIAYRKRKDASGPA